MSGNNEYIKQLAEASRDMEGASLTIGARIDDEFANTVRETMRLPQFADGAKASDLSIAIFGDTGNSHVLAVDTRLLLMRDAGEVVWENGLFRLVEAVRALDSHEEPAGWSDVSMDKAHVDFFVPLAVIEDRETVRRMWNALMGHTAKIYSEAEYDHDVYGGFVMSQNIEIEGLIYHVEYLGDEDEGDFESDDTGWYEDHIWRITIYFGGE